MSEKVGSAEIELLLNRKRFDAELKLLSTLKVTPVMAELQLDRTNLDRQLAELKKLKIGPIDVPVQVPEQRQQRQPRSAPDTPRTAPTPDAPTGDRDALNEMRKLAAEKEALIRESQAKQLNIVQQALKQEAADSKEAAQLIGRISVTTSNQLIAEYQRRLAALKEAQEKGLIGERQAAEENLRIQKAIAAETAKIARARVQASSNREAEAGGQGLIESLNRQSQSFQDAVAESQKYTLALRETGQTLIDVGSRINEFSGAALQASAAFDSATAKVATLSDDADALAERMKSLSGELDNQVTSLELMDATYDVVSSGFSDAADITEILRASTLGAVGGFSELGTVSDATTTILNAFQLSASDAGRVVDILAATQDKGKITIDQYAQGIGRAASIAAGAGVSFEEFSAAIATATAQGVPAESAISGARQAIVNLLKPTDDAKKALEEYGISNVQAVLKTEGLVGVLQRLDAAGINSQGLGRIFSDVDGLATVSTLAGEKLDLFRENIDAVNNSAGKAAAAAEKISSSYEGEVTQALNQSAEALQAMGKGVQDAVTPLLAALNVLLENFNELPDPVKEAVGVIVALTGGAITLGGALAILASTLPIIKVGLKELGVNGVFAGQGLTASGVGARAASGSFRLLSASTGALIVKLGLVAAAVNVLQNALSRFKDGGAGFNAAADKIQQKLIDLQIESGKTREALESSLPEDPPPTDWIDGIATKINDLQRVINKAIPGRDEEYFFIPTNAQKQVNDARIGVENLNQAIRDLTSTAGNFKGSQEEARSVQDAFNTAITETRSQLEGLDASKLGTKAYEQFKTSLEGALGELEREKAAFEQRNGLAKESAAATEEVTEAVEEQESALTKLGDRYASANQAIEVSAKQRQTEIATSIAEGLVSEEEGRKQSLAAEESYLNERIKLNQQKLQELKAIKANSSDAKEVQAAGEQILEIEGQIADDRLTIAQASADARKAAEQAAAEARQQIEQDALEKLEAASKQADQAIATSQANRVAAIRQAQLEGVVSAQQAEAQIQAIQNNGIAQTIAARQNELNQVRALRQAGTISAEEATGRESQLIEQIAGLRQQAVEAEIAAQQKLRDEYFKTLELQAQAAAQAAEGKLDSIQSSLQAELDLQAASMALEESRRDLAVERLNTQKAIAEAAGDEQKVARINQQIRETQAKSEEAIFDEKERQLELTQKLRDVELQRQRVAADLAVIEAQIALERARAEGASSAELQLLQTSLNLRQQQVAQLQNQTKVQQQINQSEQEQLANQRAISQERSKQAAIQERIAANEQAAAAAATGATAGSSGGVAGGSAGNGITRLLYGQDAFDNMAAQRTISDAFRAGGGSLNTQELLRLAGNGGATGSGRFINEFLSSAGREDVLKLNQLSRGGGVQGALAANDIARAIDAGTMNRQEVTARLDQLIAATNRSASRPNLTISNVDDIGLAGRIYSDISRSNMRSAGM